MLIHCGVSVIGEGFSNDKKVQWIDSIFLFSLVWSVGCTTNDQGRSKFDTFLREVIAGNIPEEYQEYIKDPVSLSCPSIPDADGSTIYDYVFCKETSTWILWTSTLSNIDIPAGAEFSDIIVPTKDSARCLDSNTEQLEMLWLLVVISLTTEMLRVVPEGKSTAGNQACMQQSTRDNMSSIGNVSRLCC